MHARNLLLLSAVLTTACTGDSETETSRRGCEVVVSEQNVLPDEQTSLGTANEWSARGRQLSATAVSYVDSLGGPKTSSPLTLELTLDSRSARVVERRDDENAGAICPDRMEIPGALKLLSADGSFDEIFMATASIEYDVLQFESSLPLSEMTGKFRPSGFSTEFTHLQVHLFARGESSQGSLTLQAPDSSDRVCAEIGSLVALAGP